MDSPDSCTVRRTAYERHMWLFAVAFALLASHELDAMIRQEWRLLPGFGGLTDAIAADAFNLLHVPLFTLILMGVMSTSRSVRVRTSVGVELFLLCHAIAHTVLRGAENYRFEAPVETITIYGSAAVAALHFSLWRR